MAGYTRQSASNIASGLPIQSADINAEFNQLVSAFNASTGHNHDGSTTGNGPKVNLATSVSGTLTTASGGTNATSWTAGSIPYLSNSTTFAQDNANFFWDVTNHRLGIATTTPVRNLSVVGSTTLGDATAAITIQNSGGIANITGLNTLNTLFCDVKINAATDNIIYCKSSNGNVGIGNVSLTGAKLAITGTTSIVDSGSGFSNTNNGLHFNFNSNIGIINCLQSGTAFRQLDIDAGLLRLNPSIGGGVTIYGATLEANYAFELPNNAAQKAKANAWDTYSDERIKDKIETIKDGIDLVNKLNPVRFIQYDSDNDENGKLILKENSKSTFGLIAQEVHKVLPEIVNKGTTEDELWGIDYQRLSGYLIAAIQDLSKQIDELKSGK